MFTLAHRPLNGQKGMSQAKPCYNTTDNSAWGGSVLMDDEYWNSAGKENGCTRPRTSVASGSSSQAAADRPGTPDAARNPGPRRVVVQAHGSFTPSSAHRSG
ncbi:hypothetical protein [Streptomyces sp. RTd22]|uniref:hypothetical protein n=1 Tax=Streptomyces sp. RTd22 TaxID=1841249 RepID=UPI0007C55D23|nr:hypothetical protein [Streptomyces sp. RTd22]